MDTIGKFLSIASYIACLILVIIAVHTDKTEDYLTAITVMVFNIMSRNWED